MEISQVEERSFRLEEQLTFEAAEEKAWSRISCLMLGLRPSIC